jgi:hypothetical protein
MTRSTAPIRRAPKLAATLGACASIFLAAGAARADDTIKHPGDHPHYSVEIEPHALFGWENLYYSSGFGLGGRFSIPIVENGFVPSINNSVAISFGLDWLHYSARCGGGKFYIYDCNANYLVFPVAMQWNFFVAQKWSVFGEPGLFIYHGIFDDCPANAPCSSPTATGVRPAFYVGGRYHFTEHVALTMRLGYPTFSVGVSFM